MKAGRNEKVNCAGQTIPETVQQGDEEVRNDDQAGDAEVVRSALPEQHCGKNARPDAVAERRDQAAEHRLSY